MQNETVRHEVAMYWRLLRDINNCPSQEEIDEAIEELEALATFTESDTVKRLCQKTIVAHRPLHIVSVPG